MFGFRHDGRRLNDIEPMVRITPYFMPTRVDAQVFLEHKADYELMARYIASQGQKGEKITFMQIIVAAYVRAIGENPDINRFILNKQYFSRTNCSVAFNILRDPHDAEQGEAVTKVFLDLYDTIYDVRDRMNAAIEKNRGVGTQNFLDKLASFVLAIPGLPTLIVGLVKLLDRYGICPGALLDELPFHVGMYITNNASIGLHHVNHHIYNFGNVSMFFGMGLLERVTVIENGNPRMKRYLPIGVTVDERVCSGAHFAGFFASMTHYMNHPELLETPPETVKYDKNAEYHIAKIKKD